MIASFLAQNVDWIEGAIIVVIVLISALGSAAKWIMQQIQNAREREAQRRSGTQLGGPPTGERRAIGPPPVDERWQVPPVSAPLPPELRRSGPPQTTNYPPVMERVMEVLVEKATGTRLERRIRELAEQTRTSPPAPPRLPENRARKQAVSRPPSREPKRPMTIAEREARRDQIRQSEAERETKRLAQREEQFTADTDKRIGHVQTHIIDAEAPDTASEVFDMTTALDDPEALRRALVLSEILAPPLALRPLDFQAPGS